MFKLFFKKSLDYIVEALKNNSSVEFRNFGVFEVRTQKKELEEIQIIQQIQVIPSRKVVKFKPGKIMKQKKLVDII